MTYRGLYLLTIAVPPAIIGGFEYVRHDFLLPYMSMGAGNLFITILTLLLSYLFSTWVFQMISRMNQRLVEEQARRAVYEERERLARELHDGIAQSLFFLNVKLKQQQLDEAKMAVSAIDNHVRQAIFNLRALPEEGSSFKLRLDKWLTQWSALSGVEVSHDLSISDGFFTTAEEVLLFGIIQEAFSNIRKHANAKHATVLLHTGENRTWQLKISDDGDGISDETDGSKKYGMVMMRERADQLHATVKIQRAQSGGTEIILNAGDGGKNK